MKELANNIAKSLARKADRSDLKKALKEVESKLSDRASPPIDARRSNLNSSTLSQSHSHINRSQNEIDFFDPENCGDMNSKRIRSLIADVDILKKDLLKISTLHVENSKDISEIREDLENDVKQVYQLQSLGMLCST